MKYTELNKSAEASENRRDTGQIAWLLIVIVAWIFTGAISLPGLN